MTVAVSIKGLSKVYGKKKALDAIDLEIQEGDFFGLLGPNGAGKSTTIGILTGLVIKDSGTAEVLGHETTKDFKASRSLVGVVPQEFNFDFFLTVEKALLFAASFFGVSKKEAMKKIDEILPLMDLEEKRHAKLLTLSGGMKRRFMIVRALLHSPKVLILDEPTAGVDVELRRKTWEIIQKFNDEGMTILLTTHYLEEAEALCNRIAIIDQGKILLNEDKRELMKRLESKEYLIHFAKDVTVPCEIFKRFSPVKCGGFDVKEHLGTEEKNCYRFQFPKRDDLFEFLKKCADQNLTIVDIFAEKERLEDFFVRFLGESNQPASV